MTAPSLPVRPVIKPALRRLWRDATTLQLGVDPERAVVLTGVGPSELRLLRALDGTISADDVPVTAAVLGVPPATAARMVGLLADAGALDDGAADQRVLGPLSAGEQDRLRPDLASLSLAHPEPGRPAAVLGRRRAATVIVRGAGRIGASVAALLAAAGVGRISVVDRATTRPVDVSPGGLGADDVGRPRADAVHDRIHAAAPSTRLGPLRPSSPVDLIVMADGPLEPAELARLLRGGTPHLLVGIRETTGVIGPLVVGTTGPCARCLDLTRRDRDPAWPSLSAQLAAGGATPDDPCDIVLAAAVAAHAVFEVLAHLDRTVTGGPLPASVGGTLELSPPDWRVRRRSWPRHPACGCDWAA